MRRSPWWTRASRPPASIRACPRCGSGQGLRTRVRRTSTAASKSARRRRRRRSAKSSCSCPGTAIRPSTCTTGMSACAAGWSRRSGRLPRAAPCLRRMAPLFRRGKRPDLVVSEERGVRHLHVGGEAIQSAMRLDDPFALELDYTRCMMAFLLFHPRPRRALMIGLGGGSLAKFFHRRLNGLRTHVVEYDERVIATARALFHVPADDARLVVEHGDGVEALAPECCDLLVVDGY